MFEPATDQDVCRAAASATSRPAFLAAVFARLQAAEHLEWDGLANRLGVAPATLCRMALCLRPRSTSFRQDVVAIATRFHADVAALAQVIRFVDTLDAFADQPAAGGLLAAARDVPDDDDLPGEPRS